MGADARQVGGGLASGSAPALALAAISAVASFTFFWQLGSSSFFVDEAASMNVVATPFGDLLSKLTVAENTPAGYFAVLDLWTSAAGSDAEWVARLPSAVAAVALVLVVYRLGMLVSGRPVGLIAALLVALSPVILQYAQQARPYAMTMLAVGVGAVGALEAERKRSWLWVVVGTGGFAAALSMHYATLAVVVPFCLWMITRRGTPLVMRVTFCGALAATWLAWLPLAVAQRNDHPSSQLGESGTLTAEHLVRVIAAPFDDRYTHDVGVLKVVAALLVIAGLGAFAGSAWRQRNPERILMVGVVLLSITALIAASAIGIEILNSRYMTFALPFIAVVLAVAIADAPRSLGIGGLTVLLAIAVVFNAGSHRPEAFYPDTRGVVAALDAGWRPGDAALENTTLGAQFPLNWYVAQQLPEVHIEAAGTPAAERTLEAGYKRIWIVRQEPRLPGPAARTPPGYESLDVRTFEGSTDLSLELAVARD